MASNCLIYIIASYIMYHITYADGYNLTELLHHPVEDHFNADTLFDILHWCVHLQHKAFTAKRRAPKRTVIYHDKVTYFMPQITVEEEAIKKRKHPQQITSYWSAGDASIYVYFPGIQSLNEWDKIHQNNWIPKEITITKGAKHIKMKVHSGVYDAVNTEAFYESFLNAIWDIKRYYQSAKSPSLWLSGHGFGGAIASLIPILWNGGVNCDFTNYIRKKTHHNAHDHDTDYLSDTKQRIRELLDTAYVVTFGAFGFIQNGYSDTITHLWHPYHGENRRTMWINVIRAKDVYPMMFNGAGDAPTTAFKIPDGFQHVDHAYYAPIGDYVVILPTNDNIPYRLLTLDPTERWSSTLYKKHLVNGAETFNAFATKNGMLDKVWALIEKENAYEEYRKEIGVIVEGNYGDGYSLTGLLRRPVKDDYQYSSVSVVAANTFLLDVLNWCILLQHKAFTAKHPAPKRAVIYKEEITYFIPQITIEKEAIKKRKHPQQITSYWTAGKATLYIYFPGIQPTNEWDKIHQNNWIPKEITITKGQKRIKMKVHTGVYDAVNTEAFYISFLNAIWDLKHFYERTTYPSLRLSGHGFGGAIASLIPILWNGFVDCNFTNYIWKQTLHNRRDRLSDDKNAEKVKKRIRELLDGAYVITFGAFGFIQNGYSDIITDLWHPYHRSLRRTMWTNVIRAKDVYPMMFNGAGEAPTAAFKITGDFQHVKHAYYAPIGDYVVILPTNDNNMPYRLLTLDPMDRSSSTLYEEHLLDGAETFNAFATNVRENGMLDDVWTLVEKENDYEEYRKEIGIAVEAYTYSMRFKEPLQQRQSMTIVMIGVMILVFVLCAGFCLMCGTFIGLFAAKYDILAPIKQPQ